MYNSIEKQDSNFRELKDEINEKFEAQKNSFDELKNEIQEMHKCFENNNERLRTSLNKLEQSVERMGVHVMSTDKSKTNENYNDMCQNVILDKQLTNDDDDVENNENSDVIENVVSESNDEVGECDNEMLMYAYELERERKDSIEMCIRDRCYAY